ncbi:hypothetical protein [Mycolicibacterium wolinskyi]|uniref:hypothetical protein n=1 Tax=Mycolicibacterium wolinskyi TaxID=59750 RepID=UPI0008363B4C|nr:hypothetical protein [Mycolicibacterium wolinskyi]
MTEIDETSPEIWVQRAMEHRDGGDLGDAKSASLLAARAAMAQGRTLPNEWSNALSNDQQAQIEFSMNGEGPQYHYYLGLALSQALDGLDRFEG